ncbi:MAG: S66 peptidase family protein [Desulfomonilaceae bacterium]
MKPIIPKPLSKGCVVGVAAISGPVNATDMENGASFLEKLGFRVRFSRNLFLKQEYLAGCDAERAEGLNIFLADPEVRGIFFARGGYGSMRVIPKINYDAILRDPKLMLGMSDITAFSLAAFRQVCIVTLAGPMLAGQVSLGLDSDSENSLIEAITCPIERYQLIRNVERSKLKILQTGKTGGYLIGGCLSLIVSLVGAPYCPNFQNCILFIEDVNEPVYKIDRMLTQLKLAGVFDQLNGVIICQFSGEDSEITGAAVERIVLDYVNSSNVPVISNYPHGHTLPNMTLPVGIPVSFEVSEDSVTLSIR